MYDTAAKRKAYQDKWYAANKELHKARCDSWRRRNLKRVRKYARDSARRRAASLKEIKLAVGCTDCGYRKCAGALEFDHIRGRKKFNICNKPTVSPERLKKEMAKCEIVCANCHAERTERRRNEKRKR